MMPATFVSTVFLLVVCLAHQAISSRWLILGLSTTAIKSKRNCDEIGATLLNNKQVQICKRNVDFMPTVRMGAALALKECQYQFQHRRWNCTTVQFDRSPVFGNSLNGGTREAAFVHAISSAGVAWTVTRACSLGKLGRKCGCDEKRKGESPKGWTWAGCSEDIDFGDKFSKDFVDARERGQRSTKPYRVVMNLHNNVAGREAVKGNMKDECKCHGVSGSCNIKTCWRSLPDFREVGDYLKEKFDGATWVEGRQIGSRRVLVPVNQKFKPHTKNDLVYVDASPNFCEANSRTGSLGTKGRICNRTSQAMDGCDLMCCQRGYTTQVERKIDRCNCKFFWCCYVKCEECQQTVEVSYCK